MVEEALEGLPGVRTIESDLARDLLRVLYDPGQVTPERMLEIVGEHDVEGEIVVEDS